MYNLLVKFFRTKIMIYAQIIFAWIVIVFLVLCMLYCLLMLCDETETLSQYIPWLKFPWRLSAGGRGLGCLISIPFFAVLFIFFFCIMYIWENFIHNQWPQKPQVSIEQQVKKPAGQNISSQNTQPAQKTLLGN